MSIFNINIGGIDFSIDDDRTVVSYSKGGFSYEIECGKFSHDRNTRQIIVCPTQYEIVNSVRRHGSRLEISPPLRFDNNTLLFGQPLYDTFFSMQTLSGEKIMRALINTYLESSHFEAIAGQKSPCFDPLDEWGFKHPIEFTLSSTPESGAGLNDGVIEAVVVKPDTGMFEMRLFDANNSPLGDWVSVLSISDIAPGNYRVQLRNLDNGFTSIKKTVLVEPYS